MKTNDKQPNEALSEPLHKTDVGKSALISDLDLSIRTKNLFSNAGIKTIDDLLQYTSSDLKKFRNFGNRSLKKCKI
ncbi:MAG: hypothetical protein IPG00_09500 [Saprospiraceae bacterium]|nr:hypothetical protein [Saprospiraceae bacterium]